MTTSQNGRGLVEGFEGLRLESYQDQSGIWTIGYGHTGVDVVKGLVWTPQQADDALEADLASAEHAVNSSVLIPITQNMFDALVSFTYNLGAGALKSSLLIALVNGNEKLAAAAQFLRWDHVNKIVIQGLLTRRTAERDLFLKPETA